jgi:hypothetical protein
VALGMHAFIHQHGRDWAFFHWNLDQSVGRHAQNGSAVDVTYLQWYYSLAAAHPNTPPDRRAVYGKVKLTGACSGRDDDPLVQAIMAHQQALNHPVVDGRISVATGTGSIGASAFFILRLNARFAHMYPTLWPRVDQIRGCPPKVAEAVRAAIPMPPGFKMS